MTAKAIKVVASWDLGVRIVGLWVDEDWQVEIVGTNGNSDDSK